MRSVLWWWLRHRRCGRRRRCPRLSRSKASTMIDSHNCAARRCSSWRLGHRRASSSLSGIGMPSSRFIAEAYPCCGWRGARNICCCRSHWTRSSGHPPLCSLVRCFNGSWSRWTTWSRYWLACRSLFCWIGCCRFLLVMCLLGRDVACRSRAWLDSTGLRAARVRALALPLVTCATGIGPVIMRVTSRHRSSPHRAHAQDLLAYRYPGPAPVPVGHAPYRQEVAAGALRSRGHRLHLQR